EVAFVGKSTWQLPHDPWRGLLRSTTKQDIPKSVSETEILATQRPMIKCYALERLEGECFGDFVIRAGYIAPTTEGEN
ncbi:hypothetical protein EDD17DRAFT_1584156, partial [Pisolithus thermaeus]